MFELVAILTIIFSIFLFAAIGNIIIQVGIFGEVVETDFLDLVGVDEDVDESVDTIILVAPLFGTGCLLTSLLVLTAIYIFMPW